MGAQFARVCCPEPTPHVPYKRPGRTMPWRSGLRCLLSSLRMCSRSALHSSADAAFLFCNTVRSRRSLEWRRSALEDRDGRKLNGRQSWFSGVNLAAGGKGVSTQSLEDAISKPWQCRMAAAGRVGAPTHLPVAVEFSNWRSEQRAWRESCALVAGGEVTYAPVARAQGIPFTAPGTPWTPSVSRPERGGPDMRDGTPPYAASGTYAARPVVGDRARAVFS